MASTIIDSVSLYLDENYKETMHEYSDISKSVNSGSMTDQELHDALEEKGYSEDEIEAKIQVMKYIAGYNEAFLIEHSLTNEGMGESSVYTGENILLDEETAKASVRDDRNNTSNSADSHLNADTLDAFIRDSVSLCVYTEIDPSSLTMDYTIYTDEFEELIEECDIDISGVTMTEDRMKMCQLLLDNGLIPTDEDGLNDFFDDFDNNLLKATSQWVEDPSVSGKDILLSNMMLQTHVKSYANHNADYYLEDLGTFGNIMVNGDTALNILGKDSVYEMLASQDGVGVDGKDIHNNGLLVDDINPDCYKYTEAMMATLYTLDGINPRAVDSMIATDSRSLESALYSALIFPDSDDEFTTNYKFLRDSFTDSKDTNHQDGLGEPEDYLAEVIDYINETYDDDIDVDEMLKEFSEVHEGGSADYSLYRYFNNGDTIRDITENYPYFEKALMLSVVDECSDYGTDVDGYMDRQNNMAKQIADASVKDHGYTYDDENYVGMLFLQDISMHDASALIHNSFENVENSSIRYYYDLYPVGNKPSTPDEPDDEPDDTPDPTLDPDPTPKIRNLYHLQTVYGYPQPIRYTTIPRTHDGQPFDLTRTHTDTETQHNVEVEIEIPDFIPVKTIDSNGVVVVPQYEEGTNYQVVAIIEHPDEIVHGREETYTQTQTVTEEVPKYTDKDQYDVSGTVIVLQNEKGERVVVNGEIASDGIIVHGRIDEHDEKEILSVVSPQSHNENEYTIVGETQIPGVTEHGRIDTFKQTETLVVDQPVYGDATRYTINGVINFPDTVKQYEIYEDIEEQTISVNTGSAGVDGNRRGQRQNNGGTGYTNSQETYSRSRSVQYYYDDDGNKVILETGSWNGDTAHDFSDVPITIKTEGKVTGDTHTETIPSNKEPESFRYSFTDADLDGMSVEEYIAKMNANRAAEAGGELGNTRTDSRIYQVQTGTEKVTLTRERDVTVEYDQNGNEISRNNGSWKGDTADSWAGAKSTDGAVTDSKVTDIVVREPETVAFDFTVTDSEIKAAGYNSFEEYAEARYKELEEQNGGTIDRNAVKQDTQEITVSDGDRTDTYTRTRHVSVEYDQDGNVINSNDGTWAGDNYDGDWSGAQHIEENSITRQTDIVLEDGSRHTFSYTFDVDDIPENMTREDYIQLRNEEWAAKYNGRVDGFETDTQIYDKDPTRTTEDFHFSFIEDEAKAAGYDSVDDYIEAEIKKIEEAKGGMVDRGEAVISKSTIQVEDGTVTETYVRDREVKDIYDQNGTLIGTQVGEWTGGEGYTGDWSNATQTEGEKTVTQTDITIPGVDPEEHKYSFDLKDVPEGVSVNDYINQMNQAYAASVGGTVGDVNYTEDTYQKELEPKRINFEIHVSDDDAKAAGYTDAKEMVDALKKDYEEQYGGTIDMSSYTETESTEMRQNGSHTERQNYTTDDASTIDAENEKRAAEAGGTVVGTTVETTTTSTTTTYTDHYNENGELTSTESSSSTSQHTTTESTGTLVTTEMQPVGTAEGLVAANDTVFAAENPTATAAQPTADATAAQPTADATAAQPTADATAAQPTADATAAQPTADATVVQPTVEAAAAQPTAEAAAAQPTAEAAAAQPTADATATPENTLGAVAAQVAADATTAQPTEVATAAQPTAEAAATPEAADTGSEGGTGSDGGSEGGTEGSEGDDEDYSEMAEESSSSGSEGSSGEEAEESESEEQEEESEEEEAEESSGSDSDEDEDEEEPEEPSAPEV